jgi:hypothetical protein
MVSRGAEQAEVVRESFPYHRVDELLQQAAAVNAASWRTNKNTILV